MTFQHADTASRRPATGLDVGARQLILQAIDSAVKRKAGRLSTPETVISCFFRDRYGDFADYSAAVDAVWDEGTAFDLQNTVSQATPYFVAREFPLDAVICDAVLRGMPEPDFRFAIEETLRAVKELRSHAARITTICSNRGAPWRFDPESGFEWVGDQVLEREVLEPAKTILQDARFVEAAVRAEFEAAREHLKAGKPLDRKHALTEASNAVESAMKVVLAERHVDASNTTAQNLFTALRDNGMVGEGMESMLLAVPRARNKRGGHGGGVVVHEVEQHEAEAFVAAAATAIVFLGQLLT